MQTCRLTDNGQSSRCTFLCKINHKKGGKEQQNYSIVLDEKYHYDHPRMLSRTSKYIYDCFSYA